MLKISDSAAFLLAGGKSSRMGTDKGLVEFQNQSMASRILNMLSSIFLDVNVNSNNSDYSRFGFPVFSDSVHEKGPAGGILSAFENTGKDWIFVIACDMPLVTPQAILKLHGNKNNSEICLPVSNNNIEPLCGFYHSSIQNQILHYLNDDILKMQQLVKKFNLKLVEFDSSEKLFLNINSKDDLMAWKEYES